MGKVPALPLLQEEVIPMAGLLKLLGPMKQAKEACLEVTAIAESKQNYALSPLTTFREVRPNGTQARRINR